MTKMSDTNALPITPRFKKQIAPSTPKITVKKRSLQTTPHRYRRHGTPSTPTPRRLVPSTGDRFIPNRCRTDFSRGRRTLLWNSCQEDDGTHDNDSSLRSVAYQTRLKRVLFDDCNANRMMEFGPSRASKERIQAPHKQDILRASLAQSADSETGFKPEMVAIRHKKSLDAPDMLCHSDLTLVSCFEDTMAVALGAKIWLWKDGKIGLLADMINSPFTCIKFSENGKYLAAGHNECFQVFHVADEPNGYHDLAYEKFHHDGCVVALAWHGTTLVASAVDGIKAVDLTNPNDPDPVTYGNGRSVQVRSLEWKDGTIASAAGSIGEIQLFSAQTTGENHKPRAILHHEGVRSIEFAQMDLLFSGGKDSVRVWNANSGKLKGEIKTESQVMGTVYSDEHKQLVVADETAVSLWSLCPKVNKLDEYKMVLGRKITNMYVGPQGTVVCSCTDECLSLFSIDRDTSTQRKRRTILKRDLGALEMPVIR